MFLVASRCGSPRSTIYLQQEDTDSKLIVQPRSPWVLNLLGKSPAIPARDMSNLTARPKRRREMKVPASLGAQNENVHYNRSATPATDDQVSVRRRKQDADNFSRTIHDLEGLLREALVMAHQAADKDNDSLAVNPRHATIRSNHSSRAGSSLSGGPDEEEHYTSVPLDNMDKVAIDDHEKRPIRRALTANLQDTSARNTPLPPRMDAEDINGTHVGGDSNLSIEPIQKGPQITVEPPTTQLDDFQPFNSTDWAVLKRQPTTKVPEPGQGSSLPRRPTALQAPLKSVRTFQVRPQKPSSNAISEDVVQRRIKRYVCCSFGFDGRFTCCFPMIAALGAMF